MLLPTRRRKAWEHIWNCRVRRLVALKLADAPRTSLGSLVRSGLRLFSHDPRFLLTAVRNGRRIEVQQVARDPEANSDLYQLRGPQGTHERDLCFVVLTCKNFLRV